MFLRQLSFSLFLALTLSFSMAQAQEVTPQTIYQQFEEASVEELHVYAFSRQPADFLESSLYPFKGKRLDSTFNPLLEQLFKPSYPYTSEDAFFATHRFYITGQYEGLLLREFKEGGQEHHIHLLVYDNQASQIAHHQTVAYGFGYEGATGGRESWITDLNRDGQLDLISRQWEDYYSPMGEQSGMDSTFLSIWSNQAIPVVKAIEDSLLEKSLAKRFPYYHAYSTNYSKELQEYFDKDESKESTSYYLVLGSYPSLDGASAALELYKEQFIRPEQYHLDFSQFEIHKKGPQFKVLISGLYYEVHADILQHRLQGLQEQPIPIIRKEDYCPKSRYKAGCYDCKPQRPGYYECEK